MWVLRVCYLLIVHIAYLCLSQIVIFIDMKTYVVNLSTIFPAAHPKAGHPTKLGSALNTGLTCHRCKARNRAMCMGECFTGGRKIHAICPNFPLWKNRIAEVQRGEAVLSVRQWEGEPFLSHQREIKRLAATDGIGVQEVGVKDLLATMVIDGHLVECTKVAQNDGLSFDDWFHLLKGYDLSKSLAIIQFTNFRY